MTAITASVPDKALGDNSVRTNAVIENAVIKSTDRLQQVFEAQQQAYRNNPFPDLTTRKNNLLTLESILLHDGHAG